MAEGTWKIAAASVVVAAGAGVGTALLMVPRMELPGGPVVAGPDMRLEGENRKLREQVTSLQREVSEGKIQLAAMKAFPREGSRGIPVPKDLGEADEISLRAALERASVEAPIDKDRREAVVRLLLSASASMRKLKERIAAAPAGDDAAAREAEELGRETRRRLEEVLTPEQLRALDGTLGPTTAEEPKAGEKR